MSLLDHLASVPDPRRAQGRRYPLPQLLTMTLMAMLAGHYGYRAIERFLRDNADHLRQQLDWPREHMPSNVTLRAVLQALDFDALAAAFRAWARLHLPDEELIAIADAASADAKAIRSTITDYATAHQDFACLVSAYGARSGIVASVRAYQNKQTSEMEAAQALIADLATALDLRGTTVTLDALHCTKKRSAASAKPEAPGSSS